METHHKVLLPLGHRVPMGEVVPVLLHHLACDSWHVACQREHVFVLQLTQYGRRRFAVTLECTTPVDKGIYHGGTVSSIAILPFSGEPDLAAESVAEIKHALLELAWGAHA